MTEVVAQVATVARCLSPPPPTRPHYIRRRRATRGGRRGRRRRPRGPRLLQGRAKNWSELHVFLAICFATILFMKPFENWKFVTEILHVEFYSKQDQKQGMRKYPFKIDTLQAGGRVRGPPLLSAATEATD